MEKEYYTVNNHAAEKFNLWPYPSDKFIVVKAYQRSATRMRPWAYVYYAGAQVATMPQFEFDLSFTKVKEQSTVVQNEYVPPVKSHSRHMFHVTVRETTENVYNVEADSTDAAIKLATKGRLGVRLKQTLTGYNVLKAEDTELSNKVA